MCVSLPSRGSFFRFTRSSFSRPVTIRVIVGGFTPGIVPLVLGRIHELLPHSSSSQRAAWAQATTMFALFQAAGAYGLSYLFERTGGNYTVLFVIGASAVAAALAMDLITALTIGRDRKPSGA